MDHIELLNVEYGECTVFVGDNGCCFMVDCGSSNNRLRKPEVEINQVFSFIENRFSQSREVQFLLTHYHRDHMRGFKRIISHCPGYFHKIYLPYLPKCRDENGRVRRPLLDFAAVAAAVLPYQSGGRQMNVSCLNIFTFLKESLQNIYTLSSGDRFYFDGAAYEVLSPKKEDFHFNPRFIALTGRLEDLCGVRFLAAKNRFTALYEQCMEAFSIGRRGSPLYFTSLAEKLSIAYQTLLDTPLCEPSLLPQITEITASMDAMELYSEAANQASVVFHNVRGAQSEWDILMTGDAPQAVVPDFESRLYSDYNIVKAPHHGTESGRWDIFSHMGINHLLISSGDYPPGGQRAQQYVLSEAVCHCTNPKSCKYSADGCCNRLKFCGGCGALALKCKLIDRKQKPCKIYVVDPRGFTGCS